MRFPWGEHGLDGLRFGDSLSAVHFHKEVWVDDKVFQRHSAAHFFGTGNDVVRRGRGFLEIDMHRVGIQVVYQRLELFRFILGGVRLAQHQVDQMGEMLVLVRHFEGEITDVSAGLCHQAAGEVVQKIGFAGIGFSGFNNQSALVGGMKYVIRQRAVAHFVAVVVFAVEHVHDFLSALAYGDNVRRAEGMRRVDDVAHHIGTVSGHHVIDVLAVAGQADEQASRAEIVGEVLGQRSSGQVGVSADDEFVHLVQPGGEGFEYFLQVGGGAVGHADDVLEAGFEQGERVFLAFVDDEAGDSLGGADEQRVDAVDIIGGARRGGRVLAPAFGIERFSGAVFAFGKLTGGRVARTVFGVDGLAVQVIYVRDAVAHHSGGVFFAFALAVVPEAAYSGCDGGREGDALVGEIALRSLLHGVGGGGVIRHRVDVTEGIRRQACIVFGNHGYDARRGLGIGGRVFKRAVCGGAGRGLHAVITAAVTVGRPEAVLWTLVPEVSQLPVEAAAGVKTIELACCPVDGKVFLSALGALGDVILSRVLAVGEVG